MQFWRRLAPPVLAALLCGAAAGAANQAARPGGASGTPAGAPPAAEAWQPLFDGKALGGWEKVAFTGTGDVRVEKGTIVLGSGSTTAIRWTRPFPRSNYEIRLEAARLDGSDFFAGITFPVKAAQCTWINGGWGGSLVGLSSLEGHDAADNETGTYKDFEKGKWYALRLRVTDDRIDAWIDGENIVGLPLKDREIELRPGEMESCVPLGIASWETTGGLRKLEYRLLPPAVETKQPLAGQSRFSWPESKRAAISLSFDDGRASQIRNGLPLLRKYGVKATFYVTPGAVEKDLGGWKRAVADGHEIGNHTVSHPCTANYAFALKNPLESYDVARMESELDGTNAEVERLLGVKPATFAYPCGQAFIGRGLEAKSYVPLVARRFVAGRLYLSEAANDPAVCDLANAMGVGFDGMDFEQMMGIVKQAAEQGRWLIFVGHDIGSRARQTTDVTALEELVKYAKDPAHGLWIDTVESIGRYVGEHQGGVGQ